MVTPERPQSSWKDAAAPSVITMDSPGLMVPAVERSKVPAFAERSSRLQPVRSIGAPDVLVSSTNSSPPPEYMYSVIRRPELPKGKLKLSGFPSANFGA